MLKLAVWIFVIVQLLFLLLVVKWQNQPEKVGMHLVNLANILFFVVVQVLFFMYIASKTLDEVVQQKASMLLVARDVLKGQPGTVILDEQLDKICEPLMLPNAQWKKAEVAQVAHNQHQVLVNVGPIVLVLVLVLLLLVLWGRSRLGSWRSILTRAHQWGLLLVLMAYGTEFLFYIFVVRRRVFVGDWDLMRRVATLMGAKNG